MDHHVAVGVETAAVTHIAIVVVHAQGVVELSPTHTLDTDGELLTFLEDVATRSGLARAQSRRGVISGGQPHADHLAVGVGEGNNALFYVEGNLSFDGRTVHHLDDVPAAEPVGDIEGSAEITVGDGG